MEISREFEAIKNKKFPHVHPRTHAEERRVYLSSQNIVANLCESSQNRT